MWTFTSPFWRILLSHFSTYLFCISLYNLIPQISFICLTIHPLNFFFLWGKGNWMNNWGQDLGWILFPGKNNSWLWMGSWLLGNWVAGQFSSLYRTRGFQVQLEASMWRKYLCFTGDHCSLLLEILKFQANYPGDQVGDHFLLTYHLSSPHFT